MALAFLDVFDAIGSLRAKMGQFDNSTPRILPLRVPRKGTVEEDEAFVWTPALTRDKKAAWPEMSSLLNRIKREGDRVLGEIEFGRVYLELLDRGQAQPWATEAGPYIERHTRLHLALRTNPQAMMFCGAEGAHLAPGTVTAVAVRLPCCAINLGDHSRIHLVVDARKKEAVE